MDTHEMKIPGREIKASAPQAISVTLVHICNHFNSTNTLICYLSHQIEEVVKNKYIITTFYLSKKEIIMQNPTKFSKYTTKIMSISMRAFGIILHRNQFDTIIIELISIYKSNYLNWYESFWYDFA